ncbi:MAG: hypothetical protein GW762_01010 [Candidatus Pacebacteria bacterium]|nr:hypothetical protein [Candidatus Paceibacterota bacterium]PIR63177.1 MAG: hypothetical protein COU64_05675 [Candidatus Pacebacteria bacterium CG10_big_fil_rev_8_21_14_0_10_40_26]PIZ78207.1 MAG: hypothetical protein COY01_05495 [Candidatus Pacebacteria bacterium CG_4_10_14_0_2_um_filter_40_20]PJA68748.1 MAG: hypothetical protein CO156_04550 [Candidatus Pacebacteria bacterium CG_4_9_14_3_um_filter_40_12]PJC41688.1 MAG: hypothetical protein CO041_03140 [Candidatus Pacebacteria bacterium CG_4_9_
MKFLRPLITKTVKSGTSLFSRTQTVASAPTSFGERRAEEMNSRLKRAQVERQKLIRAEYATDGQTKNIITQKREMADRSISRLSTLGKDTDSE